MTAVVGEQAAPPQVSRAGRGGLAACLARLDDAIAAASLLGLPTAAAEEVRSEAAARLGLATHLYVLGLLGGTGVGKSSLLNALAEADVSAVSVRRPTTDAPVAWLPADARAEATELIERLEVARVVEHDGAGGDGHLVLLDLPDLDSVRETHRTQVEELLPRLDAVAWVTDPEKYRDAVLHDDFLRRWLDRLDRQVVVINKSDRLSPDDGERLRRDLERDVRAMTGRRGRAPVLLSSATSGAAGLRELRRWLDEGVEAKAVVANRLGAAAAATVDELAAQAGVDPETPAQAILSGPARRSAVDSAAEQVMRLVDLPGLERQAVAATRARARSRGAGPIGRLTSFVYRLSGRQSRAADPVGHLRRWRDRGTPVLAVEALRQPAAGSLAKAPPPIRPMLAAATDARQLDERLTKTVDRVVARWSETQPPTSLLWPILGMLQAFTTGVLAFAVGWVVLWLTTRPPVATLELPGLGLVPMPYVLLVASIVTGFVIARLLGAHAGWLGRRWARRLREDVRAAISESVANDAYAALDRLEAARRALWIAARGMGECRPR